MKIILYANRNTGLLILYYLLSKGHQVKVITEDSMISKISQCQKVTLDTMGEFDLFICCHGRKIIPAKFLQPKKFINIHPCLSQYKGHNPLKRYIENQDTEASVESHYITDEVDSGEVINQQKFTTGIITTYAEFYNIAYPYYIRCIDETLQRIEKNEI